MDQGDQDVELYHTLSQLSCRLSSQRKADLARLLLSQLTSQSVASIIRSFESWFHIDPCSTLPPELVLHIFSYLDLATLLTCARVSSLWRRRAFDPVLWKTLYLAQGWRFNYAELRLLEGELRPRIKREQRRVTRSQQSANSDRAGEGDARRQSPSSSNLTTCAWSNQNEPIEAGEETEHELDDRRFELTYHTKRLESLCPPNNRLRGDHRTDNYTDSIPFANQDLYVNNLWTYDHDNYSILPNWHRLYRARYLLEHNWRHQRCQPSLLPDPDHAFISPEEGHTECVYALQLVGGYLVTGSRDTTIRIWNLATNHLRCPPLRGHTQSVLCLQVDPDREAENGDVIVSGGSDCRVVVWRFSTGERIAQIDRAHRDSVLNLAFDARVLVTCSKDKTIAVWTRRRLDGSVDEKVCPQIAAVDIYTPDFSVALSAPFREFQQRLNAPKIPTTTSNSSPNTTYLPQYSQLMSLRGHTAAVNAISLTPTPSSLAASSASSPFSSPRTHAHEVTSVSGDRTIRIWDLTTGTCMRTIAGHHRKGIACVQTVEADIIGGSSSSSAVTTSYTNLHCPHHQQQQPHKRTWILCGSNDAMIRVIDRDTGACVAALGAHEGLVRSLQGRFSFAPPPAPADLAGPGPGAGPAGPQHSAGCASCGAGAGAVTGARTRTGGSGSGRGKDGGGRGVGNGNGAHVSRRRRLGLSDASRIVSGSYDGHVNIWVPRATAVAAGVIDGDGYGNGNGNGGAGDSDDDDDDSDDEDGEPHGLADWVQASSISLAKIRAAQRVLSSRGANGGRGVGHAGAAEAGAGAGAAGGGVDRDAGREWDTRDRVFNVQFDARRIVCGSWSRDVVVLDFAPPDAEVREACRFFL